MEPMFDLPGLSFVVSAVRFLLMLSVLIFVHEFGHFIVAKLCGIYVPTFSIGFGKRLIGFKWGGTDYRISALPLGGYVKMVGQSDLPEAEAAETDPDELACPDHMRFDAKPVWQRIAVSAAGPAVSIGFGIVVYWLMYMAGVPMPRGLADTRVGYVEPGGPAMMAGIEAGDRIRSIDGYEPKDWEDLRLTIIGVGQDPVPLEIEDAEGNVRTVQVRPRMREGENLVSIGVNYYEELRIEEVIPGDPAALAGLQVGDVIVGLRDAEGTPYAASDVLKLVRGHVGESVVFEIVRDGQRLVLPVKPAQLLTISGLETDGTTVLGIDPAKWEDVPRAQRPRAGDRVVAINGRPISAEDPMLMATAIGEEPGALVPVQFERAGRNWTVMLTTEARGIVGIRYGTDFEVYKYGPLDSIPQAVKRFNTTISQTLTTMSYLVNGRVSRRELAGPLGIAMVTEQAARVGWPYYLHLVGVITINLGILNILPIPVLDGGNIMIFLIEGIRRRPLSDKALYYVQHVGLVFLLFLMVFATFNDTRRIWEMVFG